MTIGNLSAEARQKPSTRSVILVAMLPIPAKMKGLKSKAGAQQRLIKSIIHRGVIQELLKSIIDYPDRSHTWRCADGKARRFYPRISSWLADYPEQRLMAGIRDRRCPWCEVLPDNLGDLPSGYGEHLSNNRSKEKSWIGCKQRDHQEYHSIYRSSTQSDQEHLESVGVRWEENPLWQMQGHVVDVAKPDVLHTVYLGVLKHLLSWLEEFLARLKLADLFNRIWRRVPPYHELSKPRKTYREVSNWQGKEIRTMAKFLLAVLAATLKTEIPLSDDDKADLDSALDATRALLEFHLYSQYKTHDDHTLRMMRHSLHRFHQHKAIFSEGRLTTYKRKKIALEKAKLQEIMKDHLAQVPEGAGKTILRRRLQSQFEKDVANLQDDAANFNLPKLHLLQHFTDVIPRFGCLTSLSTEACEVAHRYTMKDAYKKSSRNGDLDAQIIDYGERHHCFIMRRLNQLALENYDAYVAHVSRSENEVSRYHEHLLASIRGDASSSASQFNLESDDDDSDHDETFDDESEKDIPPLVMIAQQNRLKFRGTSIRTFESLQNYCNEMLSITESHSQFHDCLDAYYRSRRYYRRSRSEKDLLLTGKVYLHHGLHCPVKDYHSWEWIRHTIRCTVGRKFYSKEAREDWVWIRSRTVDSKSAIRRSNQQPMRGRLPFRVLCLFRIMVTELNPNYIPLAYGIKMKDSSGGTIQGQNAQPVVQFDKFEVIHCNQIEGLAHLIPILQGDQLKEDVKTHWIVNTHVDALTWNFVWADTALDGNITSGRANWSKHGPSAAQLNDRRVIVGGKTSSRKRKAVD